MKTKRIWLVMVLTFALAGSYMAACDFGEGGDDAGSEEDVQTRTSRPSRNVEMPRVTATRIARPVRGTAGSARSSRAETVSA